MQRIEVTMNWLRHAQVRARYGSVSRATLDRLHAAGHLPPPSYPVNPHAPLLPEPLLDVWDAASPTERALIRETWPDWRGALALIEHARAAAASPPQPRRKRGKPAKQRKRAPAAAVSASA
jgi:hypothetical protein